MATDLSDICMLNFTVSLFKFSLISLSAAEDWHWRALSALRSCIGDTESRRELV